MGFGRFVCVAVPFILTFCSLVCIMIAGLSGLSNKDLNLFVVNTTNLTISSSSFANLANLSKTKRSPLLSEITNNALTSSSLVSSVTGGSNITAADLSLADAYQISLWGYCTISGTTKNCTDGKFNWAASKLNSTTITTIATQNGVNATLPKEVTSALKTFIAVSRWTEVVYIIAMVSLALELVFGLLSFCSNCGSCLTYLISTIASVSVIGASVMATALTSVVVGTLKTTTKAYGVTASINTRFLSTTWLAVVFSLSAGLFWLLTCCCCKSSSSTPRNFRKTSHADRSADAEKGTGMKGMFKTGRYERVQDPNEMGKGNFGQDTQYYGQVPVPTAQKQGSYEPYARGAA